MHEIIAYEQYIASALFSFGLSISTVWQHQAQQLVDCLYIHRLQQNITYAMSKLISYAAKSTLRNTRLGANQMWVWINTDSSLVQLIYSNILRNQLPACSCQGLHAHGSVNFGGDCKCRTQHVWSTGYCGSAQTICTPYGTIPEAEHVYSDTRHPESRQLKILAGRGGAGQGKYIWLSYRDGGTLQSIG